MYAEKNKKISNPTENEKKRPEVSQNQQLVYQNRNLISGVGGSYESSQTTQNKNLFIPQEYTRPRNEPAQKNNLSEGSDEEFNESVYEQAEKIDDILESHDEILDLHMKILKVIFLIYDFK